MSQESLRQKIYDVVISGIALYDPLIVVKTENNKFVQPDSTWIEISISDGLEAYRRTLGSNYRADILGNVQVDIQVPEETGMRDMNLLKIGLDNLLSGRQFTLVDGDYVLFRDGIAKRGRIVDGYFTSTMLFYYTRSTCRLV